MQKVNGKTFGKSITDLLDVFTIKVYAMHYLIIAVWLHSGKCIVTFFGNELNKMLHFLH